METSDAIYRAWLGMSEGHRIQRLAKAVYDLNYDPLYGKISKLDGEGNTVLSPLPDFLQWKDIHIGVAQMMRDRGWTIDAADVPRSTRKRITYTKDDVSVTTPAMPEKDGLCLGALLAIASDQ